MFEKLTNFNDLHSEKVVDIETRIEVFKFDKSIDFNEEQL